MCHAWTHYIHGVCTSGHPLWRCSKQPIIYSTLISTHVNPHQSSHARGDCCGSHTASWQSTRGEPEKTLLGMIRTCRQTRRAPPKGLQPALLSKLIRGPKGKRSAGGERTGHGSDPFLVLGIRQSNALPAHLKAQSYHDPTSGGVRSRRHRPEYKDTPRKGHHPRCAAAHGTAGEEWEASPSAPTCDMAPAQTTASRTRPRETPACVVSLFGSHLLAHRSQRWLCQTSRPSAPSLNVLTKMSLRNVNREHSVCGFQRLISVISLATMKTSARTTETQ